MAGWIFIQHVINVYLRGHIYICLCRHLWKGIMLEKAWKILIDLHQIAYIIYWDTRYCLLSHHWYIICEICKFACSAYLACYNMFFPKIMDYRNKTCNIYDSRLAVSILKIARMYHVSTTNKQFISHAHFSLQTLEI